MLFQVLKGIHAQKEETTDPKTGEKKLVIKKYRVGDKVRTEKDLTKLNTPGMSPKFRKLEESVQSTAPSDEDDKDEDDKEDEPSVDLEAMKVEELKAYAQEWGIDLSGITLKADIIRTIRSALEE